MANHSAGDLQASTLLRDDSLVSSGDNQLLDVPQTQQEHELDKEQTAVEINTATTAQPKSHADQSEQEERPRRLQGKQQQDRKLKVKWPPMSDKAWQAFEDDLDGILEAALQGNVDKKLQTLSALVYSVGKERFGLETSRTTLSVGAAVPNRRQREIQTIRRELRGLRKQFHNASADEKEGLQQLRNIHRERLKSLRNAERTKEKRKEKARKRSAFLANPYKFTKTLLEEEKSGKLESSKEDVESYLRETHSDPEREEPLGTCDRIQPEELPTMPLNSTLPTFKEVQEVTKKARSRSAPGPNGVPYKVYKKCPKLLRRLWKLLQTVWRKGKIPPAWQQAEGCFVPKEKGSKSVTQFRTISLLNVEGKIFFSVLARRMTTYMTDNGYIDTSVQKGGIPGFSGCVEHTSALSQLLRETRINHDDLTVVWLDLANAYGSIPHQLIEVALRHYHIPDHIHKLIKSYLGNIQLRFTTDNYTTSWLRLEKGIITGCTISVILFVMGMNLIIKAAERESRGPQTKSGIRLPSNRGFMDDMTVTTQTHVQARWILTALDETATWARMTFKPRKSRSLVIKRGKATDRFLLKIQGEDIPSITSHPIKCLGKWFDSSLTDKKSSNRLKQQVDDGLIRIDRCGLIGKFKLWIYQHGLLPRLIWPMMVNEIPASTVEKLEQLTSKYLRRWLGMPPSFTSIGLYGRCCKLQLPLSSVLEEYKAAKARLLLTLRDSKDDKIRNAGIEVRTGRKWSVSQAVSEAESALRHKDIVGTTNIGREGLGTRTSQRWKDSSPAERRQMVQEEIR